MKAAASDTATIQALRSDVALQIARFLAGQQLSQSAAAKLLRVPQPTLSKIVNGRVDELSLELLIRISVRAGLYLVLQTGAVPEEAGAFISGGVRTASPLQGTRSRLAARARDELTAAVRDMTPEQRLLAHLKHSELVTTLHRAGRRSQ
jgi:predicted XRE-type DNA-binding protein